MNKLNINKENNIKIIDEPKLYHKNIKSLSSFSRFIKILYELLLLYLYLYLSYINVQYK